MKLLLVFLLSALGVSAGEISDAFYKAAKERRDVATKRREEAMKQVEKEPNLEKKISLLRSHPDLQFKSPSTGGFVFFTNNGISEIGRASTNHTISEFGLERTRCYGTCPEYTFIVTSDGRCRYVGGAHAKLQGTKTGVVSMIEFHRIAQLLMEVNYFELQDEYDASVTDNPTAFTTAVHDGKRKTISNYANAGPSRLWAFEQLLDNMLSRVRWDSP